MNRAARMPTPPSASGAKTAPYPRGKVLRSAPVPLARHARALSFGSPGTAADKTGSSRQPGLSHWTAQALLNHSYTLLTGPPAVPP